MQEESLKEAEKMDEAEQWVYWDKQLLDEGFEIDEHPGRLRDIERSRKFYLRRRDLTDELEDVFVERSSEDCEESEGEEILQVVWYEGDEDDITRTLDCSPTAARKKSNSKFTLSVCSDMTSSLPDDDSSGDDLSDGESVVVGGRFLEAKDSIEVMATSSKSLRSGHNKSSDWDEPTLEEVSCVWYSEEQTNEDAMSRGAHSLEAKEAMECFELSGEEARRSGLERTKRVSFYESCRSNDSVHSEEMFSLCRQLDEAGECPLAEAANETRYSDSVGETSSKSATSNCSSQGKSRTRKRVSFHDLPQDITWKDETEEENPKTEEGVEEKGKTDAKSKHVSFHKLYLDSEERPLDAPCLECFNRERDGACSHCGAVIYRVMPAKTLSLPEQKGIETQGTATQSQVTNEVRRTNTADTSEETIRGLLARGPRASSSSPFLASSDCDSPADSDLSTLDLRSLPGKKVSSAADVKQDNHDESNVNFLDMSHYTLSQCDQKNRVGDNTKVTQSSDKLANEVTVECEEENFVSEVTDKHVDKSEKHPSELTGEIHLEENPILPKEEEANGTENSVSDQPNELVGSSNTKMATENSVKSNISEENTSEQETTAGKINQSVNGHISQLTSPFNALTEEDSDLTSLEVERKKENGCMLNSLKAIEEEVSNSILNSSDEQIPQEHLPHDFDSACISHDVNLGDTLPECPKIKLLGEESADIVLASCRNNRGNRHDFEETKELILKANEASASIQNLVDSDELVYSYDDLICSTNLRTNSVTSSEGENTNVVLELKLMENEIGKETSAKEFNEESQTTVNDTKINEVKPSSELLADNKMDAQVLPKAESLESKEADDKSMVGIYSCEVPFSVVDKLLESTLVNPKNEEEESMIGQESSQFSFDKDNGDAPLECSAGDLSLKGSNCEVHCKQALHFSAEEYESADSDSSGFLTP